MFSSAVPAWKSMKASQADRPQRLQTWLGNSSLTVNGYLLTCSHLCSTFELSEFANCSSFP